MRNAAYHNEKNLKVTSNERTSEALKAWLSNRFSATWSSTMDVEASTNQKQ